MKKSIWIFLLAVLLPSAVLGWLALRSAEEQQIILEKRTAELYQAETEKVANAVRALIDDERRAFNDAVQRLLRERKAQAVANSFTSDLAQEWPRKAMGFALTREGQFCTLSPQRAAGNAEWGKFLLDNGGWLAGTTPATVYWAAPEDLNRPEQLRKNKADYNESQGNNLTSRSGNSSAGRAVRGGTSRGNPLSATTPAGQQNAVPQINNSAAESGQQFSNTVVSGDFSITPKNDSQIISSPDSGGAYQIGPFSVSPTIGLNITPPASGSAALQQAIPPPTEQAGPQLATKGGDLPRSVEPQQNWAVNNATQSTLSPTISDFRALTSDANEGVITRFVQNQLNIIFWLRPPQAPELIFGCLIEPDSLRDVWPAALPVPEHRSGERWSKVEQPEFVLALLDDKARPIATQPPGETARDWKRPFVASEIGEALPHWEAALYLQNPGQVRESARALRRTLSFLIAAALGAIACGGWLVVADARRQLALAQQKTDFVSNVSHELKTPLTSIRMFAELMQNGNGVTAKHPQYLRIIMVEAERLTRLINNVLDFAGLERKQKHFEKKPLDLHAVIQRTWEGHELHLQESGFTTRWEAAPPPYPVTGDDDALAQILVNLLSNAEKYASERKEVELHTYLDGAHVCVSVLDRGCGVHDGEERKIFEAFYRAHDSLSSGIQGSGLGLTLAQRLAHEHGGEITYQPRDGGGSNFTLRLPLAEPPQTV